MPVSFRMVHRVEFADTDMAGIAHFSSYFRYMEATEHAFFRSLGFSIAGGRVGWPRVRVECRYRRPLRFEDEVEVTLRLRRLEAKAVTYAFIFRRVKPEPASVVATGSATVVCVTRKNGVLKATSIPPAIARRLDGAEP